MGEMTGQGTESWDDGTEYVGEFLNGMKHGTGTRVQRNIKYEGGWYRNRQHGRGTEINLKGMTKREGEWKNGELVRWLGKTETVSGSIKTSGLFNA